MLRSVHTCCFCSFIPVEAGSFLIFWPNEDCVSCVKRCRIVGDECPSNGSLCQVKVGCKIYSGRVAASGKHSFVFMYNIVNLHM